MNDGDYAKERMLAGSLFVAWIVIAFRIGGLPLSVRAFLLFMVTLAFIWMPQLMSRLAGIASRKSLAQDTPLIPSVLRFTGWVVMMGVPLAWLVFPKI